METASTPLWPSILGIVLGGLGFLLSVSLALWNVFLYLRKPVIRVTNHEVYPHTDSHYLVLLRLAIVNQSNVGKVVYRIGFGSPSLENVQVQEAYGTATRDHKGYSFQLQNGDTRTILPIEQVFEWPLDVLPNRSTSKWIGLEMVWADKPLGDVTVSLPLYAYDVSSNRIASAVTCITV